MYRVVTLNINDQLFDLYIFYTAVLILKTLLMIPITGFSRLYYKIPANPEDGRILNAKVNYNHEVVERNRRAHLNDLENIPFFILISFLYIATTNPSVTITSWIIRIYVLSRIAHSIFYVFLKSAFRILIYQVGILINFYLTIAVIVKNVYF